MEFAQSKGNARRDGSTGVTFADVGGLGNTISEMMQVVEVRRCSRLLLV
jgi:cell division protease FtsH